MRLGMRWLTDCVLVAALVAAPAVRADAPTPPRALLAISKADHKLAIVDARTLQVVSRIDVGVDPHEVIATPDGRTAYISNMDNGNAHEIDVIDLVGQRALPPIDTGLLRGSHGLTLVGGKLWFTAQGTKAIGRYDIQSAKVEWAMGTGQDWTHMLYVTPDAKHIYTTNVSSGTVSFFDYRLVPHLATAFGYLRGNKPPAWEWVQTVIPVSYGIEGIDVSPEGREVWTATPVTGEIFILDPGTEKIVSTLDAKIVGANRVKFTTDGSRVLVSNIRNGDLVMFDSQSRQEIKRLRVGAGATTILLDPDGTRVFVACNVDGYIAVIDLKKFAISGRIDVGGNPDGLAMARRP